MGGGVVETSDSVHESEDVGVAVAVFGGHAAAEVGGVVGVAWSGEVVSVVDAGEGGDDGEDVVVEFANEVAGAVDAADFDGDDEDVVDVLVDFVAEANDSWCDEAFAFDAGVSYDF